MSVLFTLGVIMLTVVAIVLLLFSYAAYLPIFATGDANETIRAAVPPAVIVLPNTATALNHVFGYVLYGEVQNNTPDLIALVRVSATLPSGEAQDTTVKIGRLAPGEKGCFALYTRSTQPWDDAVLAVTHQIAATPRFGDFVATDVRVGLEGARPVVTGTIRNNNAVAVDFVHVVATLYDADGKVIGCNGVSSSPVRVAQGATATFRNQFDLHVPRPVAGYALAFSGEPR